MSSPLAQQGLKGAETWCKVRFSGSAPHYSPVRLLLACPASLPDPEILIGEDNQQSFQFVKLLMER